MAAQGALAVINVVEQTGHMHVRDFGNCGVPPENPVAQLARVLLRVDRDPDLFASRRVFEQPVAALPAPHFHIARDPKLPDHLAPGHGKTITYR